MAETLYIRLGSHRSDTVHWLAMRDQNNEIIASGELSGADELSSLSEKAKTRKLCVLVSGADVALHELHVPAKSQRAIKQAAPYMLEDELAQDVDDCFFAYASEKGSGDKNCLVAVVADTQMQAWLGWLFEAGLSTKVMLPDCLALPVSEGQSNLMQLGEQVLIRAGKWQAQTLDPQLWSIAKSSLLAENQSVVQHTQFDDYVDDVEVTTDLAELPLALLAIHSKAAPVNLLQDRYRVIEKRSAANKSWLIAAGLVGITLVTSLAFKGVKLMRLNDQIAQVEDTIVQEYKTAFPETKRVRVSTIKSQLKRKLKQLGGANQSEGDFITMLASTESAFKQVPNLKPTSIKFDAKRNELRLQAIADNYQAFETFKVALEKQRFTVKQGAQNNQGDKVTGSFSIIAGKGGRS
jgi:general secretion pathway protein L